MYWIFRLNLVSKNYFGRVRLQCLARIRPDNPHHSLRSRIPIRSTESANSLESGSANTILTDTDSMYGASDTPVSSVGKQNPAVARRIMQSIYFMKHYRTTNINASYLP